MDGIESLMRIQHFHILVKFRAVNDLYAHVTSTLAHTAGQKQKPVNATNPRVST